MITERGTAFLAGLVSIFTACVAVAQTKSAPPFRALFIGNSYTYFNNLPAVIGDLAAAAKQPRRFEPHVVLVGGATLESHLKQKVAVTAIARGGWDAIVLQEQSTRPITDPRAMQRDVRKFADAAAKVGAKLVLYETRAREATPETQDSLSRVYHAAAAATRATVAHAGEAWRLFRAQEGVSSRGAHSVLFQRDGSHPSPTGTYLVASVMYATLYGANAMGLPGVTRATTSEPAAGLAPETPRDSVEAKLVRVIQELAMKVVRP